MKCGCCLAGLAVLLTSSPAFAVKPFNDTFIAEYVKKGAPFAAKVEAAKCNLCHVDGKPKKVRNEFGMAVSKHLKKDDVGAAKKIDPATDDGKKAIAAGLAKALTEKRADGKSFGDVIKAGELPAGPTP
jgi:hypothetical protein